MSVLENEISILAPGPSDSPATSKLQAVLDALPPEAKLRIQKWQDAEAAHEGRRSKINSQIEKLHEEDADLSGAIGQRERQHRHGVERSDESDLQIEEWWQGRSRIAAAVKALQAEKDRSIYTPFSIVMNRLQTVPDDAAIVAVAPPILPKGKTREEMWNASREKIAEVQAAKDALLTRGSLPIEDIKARMRKDIETRAAKGRPNMRPAMRLRLRGNSGRYMPGPIEYPKDYAFGSVTTAARVNAEHFIFWANKAAIIAALDAEIDAGYDPAFAHTAEEHKATLDRFDAELLELQYAAYGWAALLELEGRTVDYQQPLGKHYFGPDGLAVLQIKLEIPAA